MFWLDHFLTYGWQWWVIFYQTKAYFWWIESVLASHGPSSNIISRDYTVVDKIQYNYIVELCNMM
jgi:hypothetical protein